MKIYSELNCDAAGSLVFGCPQFNAFVYSHRAIRSFFAYTPLELNPICLVLDDTSPLWPKQDWDFWLEGLPRDRVYLARFLENGGITRSWNYGLCWAKELGCKYAICGNSDVLFTPDWYRALIFHADQGRLVGPVTNAPGLLNHSGNQQHVRNYLPDYQVSDDPTDLAATAKALLAKYPLDRLVRCDIGGFFLFAKTDVWWEGAFRKDTVFNPANKMVHNEYELQQRWKRKGCQIGCVPASMIFHYRAVSRGAKHRAGDWYELSDPHKPV